MTADGSLMTMRAIFDIMEPEIRQVVNMSSLKDIDQLSIPEPDHSVILTELTHKVDAHVQSFAKLEVRQERLESVLTTELHKAKPGSAINDAEYDDRLHGINQKLKELTA